MVNIRRLFKANVRRHISNVSWLFAHKVLQSIIGLMLVIWIARYLGPNEFGLLNYAQSFAALFIIMSKLGLDTIVIRDLVKYKDQENLLLGTAFVLKIGGAILSLGLLLLLLFVITTTVYEKSLIFIIAFSAIFQAFGVIDFFFQSKVLSKFIVLSDVLTLILSSLLKVLLILSNSPLEYFAAVAVFDGALMALTYSYVYVQNHGNIRKWRFNRRIAINYIQDSWPLIFSSLLVIIYIRIDQIMIKHMLNDNAVGQYAAATKLSEAWYFLPIMITATVFPSIIEAKKQDEKIYLNRIQILYNTMVWMSIGISLLVLIFGQSLIEILYGNTYVDAGNVLKIHIVSTIFGNIGLVSNRFYTTENMQRLVLYKSILGVSINITLNFLLIPKFGVIGAAIAILITQISTSLVFTYINPKTRILFFMSLKAFNIANLFLNFYKTSYPFQKETKR